MPKITLTYKTTSDYSTAFTVEAEDDDLWVATLKVCRKFHTEFTKSYEAFGGRDMCLIMASQAIAHSMHPGHNEVQYMAGDIHAEVMS